MFTAVKGRSTLINNTRDIKPSNFVITPDANLLLIDFGSSVQLLPPQIDGSRLVPKASCLVLCGTCDYISPEILEMQEEALVAFDDVEEIFIAEGEGGYGWETDWWSLGVTVYELAFGVAPFFAKDIRGTYERILNHHVGRKKEYRMLISDAPYRLLFVSTLLFLSRRAFVVFWKGAQDLALT